MVKILRIALFLAVLLWSATLAGAEQSGQSPKDPGPEYKITIIPYYSPEKLWTKFSPLIAYLREATGKPWELKLYPSHDATIEALCKGEVALALLGPVPLARSIEQCGAEPVVVAIGSEGTLFYYSLIVTTDPSITSLGQLRGKQIGLFKGSTAAHVAPLKMLSAAGLRKGEVTPSFYEGQDRIMNALLNGEVPAAGIKDALYKRFGDARLRIIKKSEPLPNFAFAAGPKTPGTKKTLLSRALRKLNPKKSSADRNLTQGWDDEIKNGFVLPPKSYHNSVMQLLSAYRDVMSEN